MQYYPIYLNITNKRCLIVGGGEVGERKVGRLLACGAQVVVVSRELTPLLERLKQEGRISHIDTDYKAAYLEGVFMAIGATNRDEINKKIGHEARERGIMVNIVDNPAECDFILPAVVRQGALEIAISTGGKIPALAKKLREELAPSFGPEYEEFIDIIGELRELLMAGGFSAMEKKKIFAAILESDVLQHLRDGNRAGVKECLREITPLAEELTGFRG